MLITGHSEPCQDTLGRKRKTGFPEQTKQHFLQKCKQGMSSSVERLSSGSVSLLSPHYFVRYRGICCVPVISVSTH